jgi:hypothetical protein
MLLAGVLSAPASAAGGWFEQSCKYAWFGIYDAASNTCYLYPDQGAVPWFCGVDQVAVMQGGAKQFDAWLWYWPPVWSVVWYNCYDPAEVAVSAPIDAWAGNCGVYIAEPPFKGTVNVIHVNNLWSFTFQYPLGWWNIPDLTAPHFYKNLCAVNIFDGDELLDSYGAIATVYYTLDSEARLLYDSGLLYMFTFENGAWNMCDAMLVDDGAYGKLACLTTSMYFGIGKSK